MSNKKKIKSIINIIKLNGWLYEKDSDAYHKNNCCSIGICSDEIVLLDDNGDFLHLPLCKFALLGALLHYRQISVDYCWDIGGIK